MHPVTMLLNVLPALLLLLPEFVAGFGNEYVHIKVHVPKEQVPSIAVDAEPAPPHKVIHHFHHHAPPHLRSRGRAPPKPKTPLLESVILSDLDKPLHMSEHADYLNHAKEIAEHLSESYAIKKPHPPPPPPKKKVNTYTIIEEKHRPNSYDYEPRPEQGVDTYRVIDSRPQHHHHAKHHHHHEDDDDDDDDVGYHYSAPDRYYRHKSSTSSYSFAEPAPVEEHLDFDSTYSYSPPPFYPKSARAPAHTLEAPEESHPDAGYQYDYNSSGGTSSSSSGGSSSGFRPSTQVLSQSGQGYEDDIDAYAAPVPTSRHRRPGPVDWPSRNGFNSAASETYNSLDSYNVGHVQGLGSSGYQYPGPYL